ncbi:hypothetical protein O181_003900 [Austropuccinia psidii MF-1]|uniref:Uncharacterized protein n=1 Tax=Austropuccinia psidii MF-1 TaxID=1389203 RepID=A0A9Q3GEC9_9BASI|nr:hypothetical protein [Austropuccinia psidii MF-1]
MVQALDGGYIIPILYILKLYIEKDLEAKVLIQQKEFSKPKPPEKKTRFEDESWEEVLKQVKELTQKITNPPQPEPQPRNEGRESVKKALNQLKTLSEAVNPLRRRFKPHQIVFLLFPRAIINSWNLEASPDPYQLVKITVKREIIWQLGS